MNPKLNLAALAMSAMQSGITTSDLGDGTMIVEANMNVGASNTGQVGDIDIDTAAVLVR